MTSRSELRERVGLSVLEAGDEPEAPAVAEAVASAAPLLPPGEAAVLVDEVLADLRGLGPLEPLLRDPDISDVLINGPGTVWVERHGRLAPTDVRVDERAIYVAIERVMGPLGLRCDPASPIAEARLADGSRVHAVVPPLAIDGPCLAIRRFGAHRVEVAAFAEPSVAASLIEAVVARRNVVVSGGTGAGKTTLLNALSGHVPVHERIITIEEAAELRLRHPHVVRFEARPANAEGVGEVTVRDLVRSSLRLRPDRIIVGECRGPETIDMLQAMNTGHAGSMSTCHANSAADALVRLATMAALGGGALGAVGIVQEQVRSALDVVVHVERSSDGGRRVVEVLDVERATLPVVWPGAA
ncbi:MAG: CpaF family protein [Acidimicrobiales bacterium]